MIDLIELFMIPETWPGLTGQVRTALLLTVVALTSLAIVRNYRDDPKGLAYKWSMTVGMGVAVLLTAFTVIQYLVGYWGHAMILFSGVFAFALFFRPLIERNIALGIVGLVGMVAYFAIAIFAPGAFHALGVDGVLLIVVIGITLLYHTLHFAEAGLSWAARIINAWPILAVLSLLAMAEAVLIILGTPIITIW